MYCTIHCTCKCITFELSTQVQKKEPGLPSGLFFQIAGISPDCMISPLNTSSRRFPFGVPQSV